MYLKFSMSNLIKKKEKKTIQKLDKTCAQAKTFIIQHGCRFHSNEKRDDLENVLKLIVLSLGIMWPKMTFAAHPQQKITFETSSSPEAPFSPSLSPKI